MKIPWNVCSMRYCERRATRWVSSVGLPSGIHAMCGYCCRSRINWYNAEWGNDVDFPAVIEVDPQSEEDFTVGYAQNLPLMVWSVDLGKIGRCKK